jgi:lipopolysaccharide export system permease protein
MLFHSSIRKDLARSFGATVVVLATIVMTIILIRTLGQATKGSVNPSEVMLVMGLTVIGHLTTILTLSLFIAVVSTLSRMYADSEMVIWFSSGKGLASFSKPLFHFAWPILVMIAFLALFVWPWSNKQIQDLKDRYEKRNDIERVAPGQFQESAGGNRVFFIDKDSPNNQTGRNVFVSSVDGHYESVTTAQQGQIEINKGERFLSLQQGQQMLKNHLTGEVRITEFKDYQLLIDPTLKYSASDMQSRILNSIDLIKSPTTVNLGELSWRVGLALAAFNLLLIGLAVASVNPRVGKSYNLALALFCFVAYYNMVNVGQNWIAAGKVSMPVFMVTLHGLAFVFAMSWLMIRHLNLSWRSLLPLATTPNKATQV